MEYIKGFYFFLRDIIGGRKILWGLAKNDLSSRFASSILGAVWAFVQPLTTILVFWFVFEVGFKSLPVSDVPFILWFVPAFLVWSFFSEALIMGTNCLREYNYLVKKVNFRVSIIPLVKIFSSCYVHVIFILFIVALYGFYGIKPSIYNLQVIYYLGCTIVFLIGLCWLLSAVAAFVPDTISVVNVLIQIGFWVTPIFWNPDQMDANIRFFLKINPMYYICRGYRDAFSNNTWFWEYGFSNVYFWITTGMIFVIGASIFKKLRPHFADVL